METTKESSIIRFLKIPIGLFIAGLIGAILYCYAMPASVYTGEVWLGPYRELPADGISDSVTLKFPHSFSKLGSGINIIAADGGCGCVFLPPEQFPVTIKDGEAKLRIDIGREFLSPGQVTRQLTTSLSTGKSQTFVLNYAWLPPFFVSPSARKVQMRAGDLGFSVQVESGVEGYLDHATASSDDEQLLLRFDGPIYKTAHRTFYRELSVQLKTPSMKSAKRISKIRIAYEQGGRLADPYEFDVDLIRPNGLRVSPTELVLRDHDAVDRDCTFTIKAENQVMENLVLLGYPEGIVVLNFRQEPVDRHSERVVFRVTKNKNQPINGCVSFRVMLDHQAQEFQVPVRVLP